MLINLRNALMAGKRLPYDAEVEYLRVDAVGPYIVIDGVTYCNAVGTYYAFTISSGGVVTHDLIPVRLGNTGYMYDRITNKRFGNAGTGDFQYGPDVVPVEYIESHGTEYIITDYVPNDNSVAELDFQSVGDSPSLMGVYSGSSRFNLGISTGNKNWFGGIGAGNTNPTTALADSSRRKLILDAPQKTLTVSGVGSYPCGSGSVGDNTAKFNLFARYSNGDGKNLYPARLYGVKFSEGADSVHSFLPVRVGTDATSWDGAMMDVLTRRIYRNDGTGAFTYGNDLKYPIPAE